MDERYTDTDKTEYIPFSDDVTDAPEGDSLPSAEDESLIGDVEEKESSSTEDTAEASIDEATEELAPATEEADTPIAYDDQAEEAPLTDEVPEEETYTEEATYAEEVIYTEEATYAEENDANEVQFAEIPVYTDDGSVIPLTVEEPVIEEAVEEELTTEEMPAEEDGEEAQEEIPAVLAEEEEQIEQAEEAEKKPKQKERLIDSIFDFVELFIFTLVGVLVISSFFFRQSIVDGGSMMNTLQDGEKLIMSDFLYEPKNGDIIVCEDYSTSLKKPIVKRVIAVGGQTVKITPNAVYVDGVKLDEPYVYIDVKGFRYDTYPSYALLENETLEYHPGEYYQLTVPEGELFVMGDHRNSSTDSREIGTIDEDSVLGRVVLRFYPFDVFGKVD